MAIVTSTLEALISYFHFSFNNWGLAIFALALVLKLVLFPIQMFNFKQQRLMAKIQPELDQLNELHKADPMKLYKEMGELKKREGVKSGFSLLTSLIQIPIFMSIYKVFSSMPALMGGSFAWLGALGAPDPLFIFPAIVALTGFVQQKLNPMPQANPAMASVMKFMPLLSLAFMVGMPGGLVAYYVVSGVLQVAGDFALRRLA